MSALKKVPMVCMLVREAQLHGIKRLVDKKLRFCWAIALVLLMWGAITILLLHISRFVDHPTNIVRLEKYRTNMSFPSVLLFPELHYHDYKIDAVLDKMEFPPDLNRTYIRSVIRQLATFYNPDVSYTVSDLENIERLLDYNHFSLREVTELLTTSCEEALLRCRWKGVIEDCSSLFRMEVSEFGYCCVFNGRSLKRELENGVTKIAKPTNRIYTTNIGHKNGLMFVLNQSIQLFNMDLTYKWIDVTNSLRYVDSSYSNGTPISPGKEVWLGYDIESFHVSEDTRFLDPGLRRCAFSDTKLQNYCLLECAMRETLWNCNCVMFTHPIHPGVPYCKARSLMCARLIMATVSSVKCGCLKTCDADTAVITISDFVMSPQIVPIDSFYEGLDFEKVTVMKVFIEKRELYLKLRSAYFTQIDLFAQMGGIFNVFFGCSVLSLLELAQLAWYSIQRWHWKNKKIVKVEKSKKEMKKKKKSK